uniref:high affinity choline transporter 1-like n=1 Tax=Styela clava TaxID=7725 RepID=UPI00193A9232|nr:high affinity choline transporter 1-like [Styela clava]
MIVSIPGLIAIVIFYLAVFIVGIVAAKLTTKRKSNLASETIMVGGRDIGAVVGFFTLTASWVGGDYINGLAEAVYTSHVGLMWALCIPIGYGLGLILVGLFFADNLRDKNYTTIIDPVQAKLGRYMGAVVASVEIFSLIIYTGAILNALGGSLQIVAGLPRIGSVIISAAIALLYTTLGGLYSVAYTDVLQLILIAGGLILCLPFAFNHEAVIDIADTAYGKTGWIGSWDSSSGGAYIDLWLLSIFGGIPWQSVVQRVLAANSNRNAKLLCILSGFGTALIAIPPILIGAVGASANWTLTSYMNGSGSSPLDEHDKRLILPIVLLYLTPPAVSFFGLGATAAAVMSSVDSTTLSCGSLFARNVYKNAIRRNASDREVVWAMRISFLVFIVISSVVALTVDSIFVLAYLSADFMYCLSLPQFVTVMYLDPNVYGALIGFIVGLILRLGGGEAMLDWKPWIHYPGGVNFPYKTFATIISFLAILVISRIAKFLFERGYIHPKYDILRSNLNNGGRSIILKKVNAAKNDYNADIPLPNVYPNIHVIDADDR